MYPIYNEKVFFKCLNNIIDKDHTPLRCGSNWLIIFYGILQSVGVSPINGLVLMWHIPTELSSARSQSQTQSRTQTRFCLCESLARAVIFLIVKLVRGFSQLSLVNVLFAFNIFLIAYFCVVSSFEPPLDHNTKNRYFLDQLENATSFFCFETCLEWSYIIDNKVSVTFLRPRVWFCFS